MFYLKELILRLKYISFGFTFLLFTCYKYKNVLFLSTLFSILDFNEGSSGIVNHFIYTHPTELFQTYLWLMTFISLLLIFPYFIWQILDFLKPSLYCNEYIRLKLFLNFCLVFTGGLNCFGFFVIFPTIWLWFSNFNDTTNNFNAGLDFFFELKVVDYCGFLFDFMYLLNILLLLILILFFILNYLGLKNLINWKKLFIFFNIVFATLLSPPDVFNQILLLFLFTILLETFIIFLIVMFKFSLLLKRQHVKRNQSKKCYH